MSFANQVRSVVTLGLSVATVAFIIFVIAAFVASHAADCAWCPDMPCYSGGCGHGCSCVTLPGDFKGVCVSIE